MDFYLVQYCYCIFEKVLSVVLGFKNTLILSYVLFCLYHEVGGAKKLDSLNASVCIQCSGIISFTCF